MKDLVDRFLRAREDDIKTPTIGEKIRTFRDVHLNASDRRVAEEDWERRVKKAANECSQRLNSLCGMGHNQPVLATIWKGPAGKVRLYNYAVALAREEYREGFIFSGRLGLTFEHHVNKETVTWFPSSLAKMLAKRCHNKTAAAPFGVGASGATSFVWKSLDGTKHYGTDAYALHCAFIKERRDLLESWLRKDIGPKTRGLLTKKVERIDRLLEAGEVVDYL